MGRKSILVTSTACLAATLLISCGSGSSSSSISPPPTVAIQPPPPPMIDSQAPSLNFTGSSTDVQGGETVVLSVLANDNVDAQVDFTLSCDGGTLNGDFLSIAETDIPFTITCTANASDAAGNMASETLEISVQTTETVLSLFGPSESLTPGEFARVNIDGVALTGESLSGTFNGEDISLTRAPDGGLLFLTPLDAAVGPSNLQLTIDNRIFSFAPDAEQALIITDPEGTLREALEASNQLVTDFLNADDVTDAQRAQLEMLQTDINTNIQNLGDVPANELMEAAQIFVANGNPAESDNVLAVQKFNEIGCRAFILSMSGALIGVQALNVTSTNLATGLANIALVGVLAKFARETSQDCFDFDGTIASIFEALDTDSGFKSEPQVKSQNLYTLQKTNRAIFTNGEGRLVSFQGENEISPIFADEVTAVVTTIVSTLEDLSFVPDSAVQLVRDFIKPEIIEIPFSEISLTNITQEAITAELSDPTLTFNYNTENSNPLDTNVDFSFDVIHIPTTAVTTIPAQLNILPEADDVMVMVTAGETVTGTVQTRGADSVRLISNPSQGQATLETDGAFSYTANAGASGQDSFSYEAVNTNGVSDPATVFVDIESLVVIARDTSIVLPAGESVTFEVDSENATSWSLTGTLPPGGLFPAIGFFPENPPGFITIRASDDAQGEFSFTYIARNGDVSDTGVISIFVTAEEEEEETPSQAIGDFSVAATLFNEDVFNNNGITPNQCNLFIDDTVPGPFSLAGSSNRDATFTISETNEGDFSINVPDQWQPAVGSPVSEIINNDIDEEGRPGFDFFRSEIISSEIGPVTITERIGMSFIGDSFDLRAESEFSAEIISENSAPIGLCQRSIRT